MNRKLEAMKVMPAWTDPVTLLWESFAVLPALYRRDSTGVGKCIEFLMLEAMVARLPDAVLHAALARETTERG